MEGIKHESLAANPSHPMHSTMTNMTGCPFAQAKYSMTAGPLGPVVMQDVNLIGKIGQFARERIPPRNVHALGFGAHATFTATNEKMAQHSCAKLFTPGKKTEAFIRFSGVFTKDGEAQTFPDLRGFAIKFYTEEGNWDVLTVNTPVFNARDLIVGPDAIHAFKRDPSTDEWNPNQTWDFIATHPESLHNTVMLYTDRVRTPLTFRHQNWYPCHTYSLINEKKERHWIRLHFISEQGWKGMTNKEAMVMAGEDPNFYSRDMRLAIENGHPPKWRLMMQIMPEEEGYKQPFTFDCTKVWKHDQYPLIEIGMIECTRYSTEFFTEVDQVAFSPANIVPGISFSPDRLLQGRLLLYDETQYHRLGPNFKQIPINFPRASVVNNPSLTSAGAHQVMVKPNAGWPQHYPSLFGGPAPDPRYNLEPPLRCTGETTFYMPPEENSDADLYAQPREFLTRIAADEMATLCENIGFSLYQCHDRVIAAMLVHFNNINANFGANVKKEVENWKTGAKTTPGTALRKQLLSELISPTATLHGSHAPKQSGTTAGCPSHQIAESMSK